MVMTKIVKAIVEDGLEDEKINIRLNLIQFIEEVTIKTYVLSHMY